MVSVSAHHNLMPYLVFKSKAKASQSQTHCTVSELKDLLSGDYHIEVIYAGSCKLTAMKEYGNLKDVNPGEGKILLDFTEVKPKILAACSGWQFHKRSYKHVFTDRDGRLIESL